MGQGFVDSPGPGSLAPASGSRPDRRTVIGSTRVARRIGTSSAAAAHRSSVTPATPNASGSNGATPYSRSDTSRPTITTPTPPPARPSTIQAPPCRSTSAAIPPRVEPSATRTPNSRSLAAAKLANIAYTPTEARSSARPPNAIIRIAGKRLPASRSASSAGMGIASCRGTVRSICASSRCAGFTTSSGSPCTRTAIQRLPQTSCRLDAYDRGSGIGRTGSLRTSATTPITSDHGCPRSGPSLIRDPTAFPLGQ